MLQSRLNEINEIKAEQEKKFRQSVNITLWFCAGILIARLHRCRQAIEKKKKKKKKPKKGDKKAKKGKKKK